LSPKARLWGRITCLALLNIFVVVSPTDAASPSARSKVEISHLTWDGNTTEIETVIHLSGPIQFSQHYLKHPDRFYIDLENAVIGNKAKPHYRINDPLLRTIRLGYFDPRTVRIVFDLGVDAERIDAVFLKNPYRIMVGIHRGVYKEETRDTSPNPAHDPLIPRDQWITDVEARLALARILSYDNVTLSESLNQYRILHGEKPQDPLISMEMGGVLIRKGNTPEALSLVNDIRKMKLIDPALIVALADLEASLGHAARCRNLYLEAIAKTDHPEALRLKLANRMKMWGDFYGATRIYAAYQQAYPEDREVDLQRAALLRSQERYAESEGVYKRRLHDAPDSKEALLGLAQLKLLEKDYPTAETWCDRFLDLYPDDPDGLLLKAKSLRLQHRYDEVLPIYSRLSDMTCCRVQGLMGMGKVYLRQGKRDPAHECFIQAHELDPQAVEIQYYVAGTNTATSDDFVDALVQDRRLSAITLRAWARIYAEQGYNDNAIRCYDASLARDPDYFPAQIGLAEVLAIDHQYARAVERFEALSQVFPDNRKILIGKARALGWGRQYDDAIALYDRIHELAPEDPVPQMEKARTAVWAKEMDLAFDTYDALLEPPVDAQLARALTPVAEASGNSEFMAAVQRLTESAEQGSIYQGFDVFSHELAGLRSTLSPDTNNRIKAAETRLFPPYAIQKGAFLERQSKRLTWDRRPAQATDAYEELLAFTPGNQEAIFDYAQLQCSLGLCNREGPIYRRLLDIDPLHSLAGRAIERLEIRRSPSIKLGQVFWSERGRDGLTEIDRYRTDLEVDVPLDCRFHLRLTGHHWIEHPSYTGDSYGADGFTLGLGGVLNPYIKGEAAWTQKMYRDSQFQNTDTGYARIWVNLRDYVTVGLGYERTDELYNYFGIQQGIQGDTGWLSLNSQITRRLALLGQARYLSYSDNNDGRHFMAGAAYELTDHPRIFKIALTGEYRNTRKQDVYQYKDGRLVDIIHPYWTPKDYYGGAVTFEWYHDLSKLLFCGSQRHFYDLAVVAGTDTEHNPSVELRAEWHYEFYDHWIFGIKGLVHRSKLWDAEGIWADLRYQF
jgi:tetratricopeptide (TPR) repeat protein